MTGRFLPMQVVASAAGLALGVLFAGQSGAVERVDVELVLAVDVSLSMSPDELDLQRAGYAAALTDSAVIKAIEAGAYGKIAVTYFEWAGSFTQHVIVPWTTISSLEDAERVARQLSASPPNSARRTSISAALEFAGDLFAESGYRGNKRVVDISGDGPNNQGGPMEAARDRLVDQGITINGLPLITNGGLNSAYDVEDLDVYYEKCVIGGPGAFMVPVNAWSQFPEAIRRKLVLELAGESSALLHKAQFAAPSDDPPSLKQPDGIYDCQIGEKLWRNRSWISEPN